MIICRGIWVVDGELHIYQYDAWQDMKWYHARAEQLGQLGLPGCDEALSGMGCASLTSEVPEVSKRRFLSKVGYATVSAKRRFPIIVKIKKKTAHKCNARKSPSGSIITENKPFLTWGSHRRRINAIRPIIMIRDNTIGHDFDLSCPCATQATMHK